MNYNNFYVGPLLICTIDKENLYETKTQDKKCCINDGCGMYHKDVNDLAITSYVVPKFCLSCGKLIGKQKEEYKASRFNVFDIITEINQRLFYIKLDINGKLKIDDSIDTTIFLPNVETDGIARIKNIKQDDVGMCVILSDKQIVSEKDIFSNFFEKEINIIKTYFDNVHISWGFIKYYL